MESNQPKGGIYDIYDIYDMYVGERQTVGREGAESKLGVSSKRAKYVRNDGKHTCCTECTAMTEYDSKCSHRSRVARGTKGEEKPTEPAHTIPDTTCISSNHAVENLHRPNPEPPVFCRC